MVALDEKLGSPKLIYTINARSVREEYLIFLEISQSKPHGGARVKVRGPSSGNHECPCYISIHEIIVQVF